jgi:hypothetical protein
MFAIAKSVFGQTSVYGVEVTNGHLISEVLDADKFCVEGEETIYDQATRLFYRLKYGEENESKLTPTVFARWQQEWIRMLGESSISIETVIEYLPEIFQLKKNPNAVPSPFSKNPDPAMNIPGLISTLIHQRSNGGYTRKKRKVASMSF